MGPMGLQCNKLQRDDLDHYRQPLQECRRGHGKTSNMPTTNRFKEERAHNSLEHVKQNRRKTLTLRLVCVVRICISTAENATAGYTAWSVADGHTMHVPGMSVAGLCARFAPTINWHRIALWRKTAKRCTSAIPRPQGTL